VLRSRRLYPLADAQEMIEAFATEQLGVLTRAEGPAPQTPEEVQRYLQLYLQLCIQVPSRCDAVTHPHR
jgi:hypothetical protein